jgi:two-component system sensor histidine kinase KdpD
MATENPSYDNDQYTKGKLKIFIGMVAGVGKTCAMLENAHALKREGRDVVIGIVETHGRARTTELSQGFEIIARKKISYRGAELEEMDIDAILKRRPELVLIDELAHTNAPSSRHPKRFMDVEEILRAGIDVYTTINVQHFESRLDLVKNLSGVDIKESVPDSILDRADQIELIDLPPDELLTRLERGEIYPKEKVERSLQGFFRRGTLTALRELALRLTAERVDREVVDAVSRYDLPQKTKTHDRLLVAIGPSPSATELLRWTRNKSFNLEAPWIAVYVDTGVILSNEDRKLLDENIELAKHLGAEILTISSPNVSEAILGIAKERQITEIVLGRPQMSFIHKLLAPESPVDVLIRKKEHFTISLVTTEAIKNPTLLQLLRLRLKSNPGEYLISILNTAITTAGLQIALPFIGYRGVGLVFIFAVLYQSLITGRGPIYVTSFLCAVSWNFFFIPPRFTFLIYQKEDFIHLVLFFAMAIVLGSLTNKARAREMAYKEREAKATFLFEVSKIFSEKNALADVLQALHELIVSQLKFSPAFYIRENSENSDYILRDEGKNDLSAREIGVAHWTISNLRRAGKSTETLPEADAIYFPLYSGNDVFGAIGFFGGGTSGERIDYSQKGILEAIAKQLSQFLEKKHYFALRARTKALEESAKLQKALFSSISHEFKTPLTSMLGSAQAIAESKIIQNHPDLNPISKDLINSGARLSHVVDELLDMSRLESGKLESKSEWVSIEDVVGLVLGRLEERLGSRRLRVENVAELPLIKADFVLLADVLRNLVVNSIQYSKADSTIEIRGFQNQSSVGVEVLDEGIGVSPEFSSRLFERFAREHPSIPGGLGLGLSICNGLMSAMAAEIKVGNRGDGKTGFKASLIFPRVKKELIFNP